jgi:hypothetical protein
MFGNPALLLLAAFANPKKAVARLHKFMYEHHYGSNGPFNGDGGTTAGIGVLLLET